MLEVEWVIVFLLLGSFVGFSAGLLGVGGGGILVPALTSLFIIQDGADDSVVHLALGTSMACIVITSYSSLRAHNKHNAVLWYLFKHMALGVVFGTFIATFIATKISSVGLALIFSLFMSYTALKMFKNSKPKPSRQLMGKLGLFVVSMGIGVISALVSIGGGSLTVPFLIRQNVEAKKAIGTSAAIGLPISIAGTAGYVINGWGTNFDDPYTFGYIYFPAVLLISVTSFYFAKKGAKLAHKLPVSTLKKIFAVLLVALSLKMLTFVL